MSACLESVPNPTLERAEALEAELLELTAHIHAGEHRQLELIAQFDENGCFGWGVRSCAHWLNWQRPASLTQLRFLNQSDGKSGPILLETEHHSATADDRPSFEARQVGSRQ